MSQPTAPYKLGGEKKDQDTKTKEHTHTDRVTHIKTQKLSLVHHTPCLQLFSPHKLSVEKERQGHKGTQTESDTQKTNTDA